MALLRRGVGRNSLTRAVTAGEAAAAAAHATAHPDELPGVRPDTGADTGPGPETPGDTPEPAENEPPLLGAAFFDLDNTVMRGASIFHMARGLYARDFFDTRDIARFGW
ncbi:MAG: HAD-IB family hydrolase, partial [Streptomycetaceae bacterium]|nr:HAD-IB family hydrolase [Streptomycetaceae bacterium]